MTDLQKTKIKSLLLNINAPLFIVRCWFFQKIL